MKSKEVILQMRLMDSSEILQVEFDDIPEFIFEIRKVKKYK